MYSEIISDIKSLKVQGAINVAKEAVRAFEIRLAEIYSNADRPSFPGSQHNIKEFVSSIAQVKEELISLRATEPCLRNSINYITSNINYTLSVKELKSTLDKNIEYVRKHFKDSDALITKYGSKRISSGMVLFTHCHASTVTKIMIDAKQSGKEFSVHNTETRPLFQGRITAQELATNGIKVQHFVDSAGRVALKKCDMMLIGADAILSDGTIINKIGSEMFAEIAYRYDIPVYICTDSWKFDPKSIFGFDEEIEMRESKEVWPNVPKNITVNNFAFEKINHELVTGIISELGIFKPDMFVQEVLEKYPWMINK